jgi:hypothetical protein
MSLAPNNPSAGVYTSENVIPEQIASTSVSTGVIVTAADRGRVGQRIFVGNKGDLRTKFGKNNPKLTKALNCAEHFLEESNALYVTRVARDSKYAGILIRTVSNFATTIKLSAGISDPTSVGLGEADIMLVYADNQGKWGDDLYVVMYPDVDDVDGHQFIFEIYEGTTSTVPAERFSCTTFYKKNDSGSQLFVEDVINNRSKLVKVKFNHEHFVFASNDSPLLVNAIIGGPFDPVSGQNNGQLFGGDNGLPITNGDLINGWNLYEDHEKVAVDILMSAGYTDLPILHTINDIAARRLDCIAVLDAPEILTDASDLVNFRRNTLNLNSSSAALYTPYLKMLDTDNSRSYFVPPSGKVGAVYAKTDSIARSWFAPAGLNRAILSGVEELGSVFKQADRNMLTQNQINFIIEKQGYGNVIWLADTLYASGGPLQDIGVRRLLAILHRIVRRAQLQSVFQPNDDFLRRKIRDDMIALLAPIRRDRGLDWYEVVCSRVNNPNDQIANGDLVCDVYLDPTRYTKRIHLNAIVPKKGAISFSETFLDAA